MKVPHGYSEVIATFGDVSDYMADGKLDVSGWEARLATVLLPAPVPIGKALPGKSATHARIHELIKGPFYDALATVHDAGLWSLITSWGGTYEFRTIRGDDRRISMHAFGIAVDINPDDNPLGSKGKISPKIVDAFRAQGFFWGGDFRNRLDPMHFQFAEGC